MRDEDAVGEAEVDCESDDSRNKVGPEGAHEVGDVAYEPDGEEGEGYSICGAGFVVFKELGQLRGVVSMRVGVASTRYAVECDSDT